MKITKKSFQAFFTRASFAGLLLAGGATIMQAQTSGTLTAQQAAAINYSTAPWFITAGPGTYPDGGGVATFNPVINTVIGTTAGSVSGATGVVVDVSPTLSGITVNTPFFGALAAGTGTSIIASTGGLNINTALTQVTPTSFGFTITSPISGGGTVGVTKSGSGNLNLSGAVNTYTGGTHFNGGTTFLTAASSAAGETLLGATGTGNGLSFNGGSVFTNVTGGFVTGRDIFLDAGGGTFINSLGATLNGVISGAGNFTTTTYSAGNGTTLTGINTYTGATTATTTPLANGLTAIPNFTLSGNGSILASSRYDLYGNFTIDNTGTNVTNRLSDTAPVTLRSGNFTFLGNATVNSSETVGAVTATNGINNFIVSPGASAANSLTIASLTRQNNATLDFRGTNLGNTPGAGVANIYVTAAPTGLVGGGGGAGTTGISILPYAIGNNSNSVLTTAAGQVGSSFVTYGANGFRTLDPTTEYATAFGVNNTDNVRITAATAAPAGVTANALLIAPSAVTTAAAPVLTGGTINVTSGAVLYSPTTAVNGFVGANLNFGAAEGVITNASGGTSGVTFTGVLSGSNGLTLTSTYYPTANYIGLIFLSGTNTYTGNTTINGGSVGISGTVAAGTPGPLGASGTLVLNGGNVFSSLALTAATTFNRDISSIGTGLNYLGVTSGGYTVTFNGNISLSNNLGVEGYTNVVGNAVTFNGTISGPGAVVDVGYNYGVFNGNNTYSGGTILGGVSASTFYAGSDTAFGTGLITFDGQANGSLAGAGTAARTLANNLVINGTTAAFAGTAPLTLTGGLNLNGTRTLNFSNTALTTFTGVASNGAITKGGTGAVAFNSSTGNTYTGGFVNTGVAATASAIYANNTSGSAFGTGTVSIGANSATVYSTLAGSFTTSGATSIAGRLSPGNGTGLTAATAGQGSIGTVAFNTSLTLSSGTTSSLYLEAASNVSNDQIKVGGVFTLAGTVNIATIGGYIFQPGDVVDFIDWGSIVAVAGSYTFNTTGASVAPGYVLNTSFFTTDGTIRVTAVPEPGTWAAVVGGLGVLGSLQFARRRRSNGRNA